VLAFCPVVPFRKHYRVLSASSSITAGRNRIRLIGVTFEVLP